MKNKRMRLFPWFPSRDYQLIPGFPRIPTQHGLILLALICLDEHRRNNKPKPGPVYYQG